MSRPQGTWKFDERSRFVSTSHRAARWQTTMRRRLGRPDKPSPPPGTTENLKDPSDTVARSSCVPGLRWGFVCWWCIVVADGPW